MGWVSRRALGVVLLAAFALVALYYANGAGTVALTDKLGMLYAYMIMAAIYAVAGAIHLSMPSVFLPVMPGWVPAPDQVILFTGACELAGAVGLIVPRTRWLAGLMLGIYAVCVFPANLKHAFEGIHLPPVPDSWWYHGPRLLLQPVLVWWALFCTDVIGWPFRPNSIAKPERESRRL